MRSFDDVAFQAEVRRLKTEQKTAQKEKQRQARLTRFRGGAGNADEDDDFVADFHVFD